MGAVKERPTPLSSPLREMGFWGVAEAAEVLGLHENTIRRWINNGSMESTVYATRRVIPTSAIRSAFGDLQRDPATRDAALERMQRHADKLGIAFRHPDHAADRESGGTHG